MTKKRSLPLRHGLGIATVASTVAGMAVALASVSGLISGQSRYAGSESVLVSRGADAANLIVVVVMVATMWLAHRGSLTALLLWPGSLFYLAYACLPYLIGAPFTPVILADVAAFLAAAGGVASLAAGIDAVALREHLAAAPARGVGVILTAIGLLAYAGLVITAISAFGSATEAAWRGHWVADWVLGTPVLVMSGILLWTRRPFGYATGPALLLVSALGGVAFAVAAGADDLTGGIRTDLSVIVVHLVISAASAAVLTWFLAAAQRASANDLARRPQPATR
ncbi:hypothetical protein [Pseudolysinimonas sp.]|uniref:hypothetical protein n=1 Tax=Pseudolysinimonas sp. TaxID=2680009 RepID=UPI003F7D687C